MFSDGWMMTKVDPSRTPEESYQRALRGWREDTFGRPGPKSVLVHPGGKETGLGLEVIQPLGLRETIIEFKTEPTLAMVYTVLNPRWYSFPVEEYMSTISFEPHQETGGTLVRWHSQWTPLCTPCGWIVTVLVKLVISSSLEYMIQHDNTRATTTKNDKTDL